MLGLGPHRRSVGGDGGSGGRVEGAQGFARDLDIGKGGARDVGWHEEPGVLALDDGGGGRRR